MLSGIYTAWTTCLRPNTSQVTWPNILLIRVVSVGGTFWHVVLWIRKLHMRSTFTWTSVSTIIWVSSAGLRQPRQWMNTSASESNSSVVKLFHFPTEVRDSWSRVCTIGQWMKDVAVIDGYWYLYHLEDVLASQYQSSDWTQHTT